MKKLRQKMIEEVSEISCDRCQKVFLFENPEFQEVRSIEFTAGFAGDGMNVLVDLCPQCIQDVLGPWLRFEPCPWLIGLESYSKYLPDDGALSSDQVNQIKNAVGEINYPDHDALAAAGKRKSD